MGGGNNGNSSSVVGVSLFSWDWCKVLFLVQCLVVMGGSVVRLGKSLNRYVYFFVNLSLAF